MKRLALLLFLSLGVALPGRAEVSVSLNFFVDALEAYGSWIEVEDYGYCWRPRVADEDPDWRPYTRGHWAYTDGGWTWLSDEEWGWATYHYGRWIRIHARWCWVPGYEWAPAWVSWRENEDALGWAPLPPEARWNARIGFSAWTDGYYDVGPDWYSFVPRRFFGERSLRSHYLDRRRNATIFEHSANITRIVYQRNTVNNIFVGGPQFERVERESGGRLQHLQLRRDASGFQREWREADSRGAGQRYGALSRLEGDQLIVAAPTVDRNLKPTPPRLIAERLGKAEIDRGWRGLEVEERDRLRGSLRVSADKNRPRGLPVRPEIPRIGWAVPSSPRGSLPAKEVRKPLPTERRLEDTPRRGPSGDEVPPPPRKEFRPKVPVPGIPLRPPVKHIFPIFPSSSGLKPGDGPVKIVPPPRLQPKPLSNQPKSLKKKIGPVGPSQVRVTPIPQPKPVLDQPKSFKKKIGPVGQPQVQVRPSPQLRPPAQPKGTPPGPSPKKVPRSSDEEEKRKQKKH